MKTTEQAFGKRLHIYTIVDAIADGNVLPFRVDYISTMREQENIKGEQVRNIDRERALLAPERIRHIVTYILEHFNQKTKRNGRSFAFHKLTNISEVASAKKGKGEVEERKQKVHLQGSILCLPCHPSRRPNSITWSSSGKWKGCHPTGN